MTNLLFDPDLWESPCNLHKVIQLLGFINTPKIVQQISTLIKDSDSNSALSSKQKRTKERLSATLFAVYAP